MKKLNNKLHAFTLSVVAVSIILLMTPARAQNHEQQNNPKINHQQVISQLSLDKNTQKSLLDLMNTHRNKHKEQRSINFKQHKEMRESHRAQVKAVLGEEKFVEFEKIMSQYHANNRTIKNNRTEKKSEYRH